MNHPNISFWALNIVEDDLVRHGEGCKGFVGIPIRKSPRFGGPDRALGRPVCTVCHRLVGRKAWRQVEDRVQKGLLQFDVFPMNTEKGSIRFKLVRPLPPPDLPEMVEAVPEEVGNAISDRIRNKMIELATKSSRRSTRTAGERLVRYPTNPSAEILQAVRDIAGEDYDEEEIGTQY